MFVNVCYLNVYIHIYIYTYIYIYIYIYIHIFNDFMLFCVVCFGYFLYKSAMC